MKIEHVVYLTIAVALLGTYYWCYRNGTLVEFGAYVALLAMLSIMRHEIYHK